MSESKEPRDVEIRTVGGRKKRGYPAVSNSKYVRTRRNVDISLPVGCTVRSLPGREAGDQDFFLTVVTPAG